MRGLRGKAIKVLTAVLAFGLLFSCFAGCGSEQEEEEEARYTGASYGLGAYNSIDSLAELKNDIRFEQQSSYDRDGGNADGFGLVLPDGSNNSGEYEGEESAIKRVLLDLQSPGVVYRMWFTNFGEVPNLRIYIDGEKVVDMSLADLASGKKQPFVAPFVQDKTQSSGGFVCYLPIVFSESIQIVGSGNFYYNIDYHVYPADAQLEPFSMDMDVTEAAKILEEVTTDPKYKSDNTYQSETFDLSAGGTKNVEVSGKRSISSIELKLPSVSAVTYDRTVYDDVGVKLSAGSSVSFEMDVSSGTVLTGRYALLGSAQTADVYVDGKRVSDLTVRKRRIDGFEWKDNTYFENIDVKIPDSYTSGKSSVTVRIDASSDLYLYHFWTKSGSDILDDYDLGDSAADSSHGYSASGTVVTSMQQAEYDPNTLFTEAEQAKIFADEDLLNDLYIRIYYEGSSTPSVDAPISSFFGFGQFGPYQTQTLMTGLKADGTMYCYYPMPFEAECRIEIVNKNSSAVQGVEITVGHKAFEGDMEACGYFSAQYSEYINGTDSMLRAGEYFTVLKTSGAGHLVGVTLSMTGDYFGETTRYYLEGDEVGYVDGSKSHSLHGTGTEDFFNGGWYFNNGTQVNALYGNPVHNYRDGVDRTVMVRTMVADYIPFRDGIEFVMEHGGANNRTDSNVYVLAYYYHNDEAQMTKTDSFAVTDETAAQAHAYTVTDSEAKSYMGSGEALYKQLSYSKTFNHVRGSSQFEVKINSDNGGVLLRRLMNADILEQAAEVYVDGEYVGIWNERQRAALGYVRWEDYLIPAKYTAGKSKITVKLVNATAGADETIDWTENEYTVFSLK